MEKIKFLKKLIIISILFFVLIIINLNTSFAATISITNDREPRINSKRTDKNYLYITLHDDAGIKTEKTTVKFNGKNCKLELIEVNDGVYASNGKRIKDIKKTRSYSGKKYDYGIKIKNSDLSSKDFKNVSIYSYDHGNSCFINETFKVKKNENANSEGWYYAFNRAPRLSIEAIDNKVQVDAIDHNGIKSIKIVSKKSNEVIYTYSASKSNSTSTNSKGITKDGVFYPFKVVKPIDMNLIKKAQEGEPGRYRFRIFVEDISGIKSEKTMTTHVKGGSSSKPTQNTKTNSVLNYGKNLATAACRLSYSSYKNRKGKLLSNSYGYYGTKLYIKYRKDGKKPHGCCSRGMSTVVNSYLKYDTGLKKTSAYNQYFHMAKSSKWKKVGTYKSKMENKSNSILKPGDIVISKRHTCMYVGNKIPSEVYEKYLKGTDADYGKPKTNYVWVSGHWGTKVSLCICDKSHAGPSSGGNIYRYVGK